MNSPHKDFTLNIYSKYGYPVLNSSGQANEIHMDGQSPSGFTSSNFTNMNGTCTGSEFVADAHPEPEPY